VADQDVAGALQDWLQRSGERVAVRVAGRATVGLSQDTWFLVLDDGDRQRDAVLRLPTPASGHRAIRTQRAALEQVAGHVPAPRLLWHDDGAENPFARPFLVMERVAGTVPIGWHAVPGEPRALLAQAAMDALADLHRLAPGELAGEAPTGLDFYLRRLERFTPLPAVLAGALWWLQRHRPAASDPVLVHGDFRMGNFVVDGARLCAVLDWEMAGSGDRLSDLAWCFAPVFEPARVDREAMVRRYEERSGVEVDREALRWFVVLGYVRLAYYALSGSRAFATGRSDDLRLAALAYQLPVHLDRLAATLADEEIT
jgi:aminoglycoside phosphotransferase (APT) family kinase protein